MFLSGVIKMTVKNLDFGDTRLIIKQAKERSVLRNQLAYILATAYHETAHTMTPVREMGGETYLRKKKYYPYVGMGYVQLTWDYNYRKAGQKLGVDFMSNPSLLLQSRYAAPILIIGMIEGWFTGKKLSDYITLSKSDFRNARRIINGVDKADLIAGYAYEYDALLKAEGYGEEAVATPYPPISPQEEIKLAPDPIAPDKPKSLWATVLQVIVAIFKKGK